MKLLNHTLSYLAVMLLVVIGAWATIFYVNMLDEIQDSIDDGLENSKLLIIDKVKEDTILLHKTDFMESNYAIHAITEETARNYHEAYLDSTLYMQNEEDNEPVRILKTAFRATNGKYYELQIVSSMVEEDDLIEDLFFAILWLYVALLASVLIINNLLLRRIWKPFYHALDNLERFKPGSQESFTPVSSNVNEFSSLNKTIASLLQRTTETFNSQKQFIENAAHELQTPLAISINKLELLTEKNTLTEDQLHEIGAVINNLERLTRLNKTLLLLSRIENRQFPEVHSIDFNALVNRLVTLFTDLAEFKSVKITVIDKGTLSGNMNAELAEILVSNLLKNAITHNYPGGFVEVTVDGTGLSVANSSGSAALDATQVFKRFYKNSPEKNSSGLGLAIVKSIADYYQLSVGYTHNGRHQFTIRFPEA
ncbi:HAMP domain-containing histidine kinase [Fulvivirgaceae bacterium PWU4]|uniref:histidine kinase n=1 Tax=Chryseosolibacter histidini TaxID=2782349 RepID=A0AAP2GIA2_9BACT|nr:HAMP domain-containing sensor histidine kinase [Chryseosolibacter histidini]MBT1696951.1 HAMP domain-containing histidine kinase [Chryseosolibacter histidini]